jgi:8-oxo-dGTP pyrophosphatase MutT (NUDIX family)
MFRKAMERHPAPGGVERLGVNLATFLAKYLDVMNGKPTLGETKDRECMTRYYQPDGHLHGVIVACQRDDGHWLLIRRSATVPAPLQICFPGGGIDAGEDQETALVREMREELDAVVVPVQCVWHYRSPERNLTLWGWLADLRSPILTPNPDEVDEILWLSAAEAVRHPDALPNTDAFLAALLKAI